MLDNLIKIIKKLEQEGVDIPYEDLQQVNKAETLLGRKQTDWRGV